MQFLVFAITYPFIWLLSRLPMRILYAISDFFFFLIYYVIGYRKKVVLENLKLAFPEKSEEERIKIAKGFFKHFTDLVMESVKSFTISEKEIRKRYTYKNIEVLQDITDTGKSIALVGTHHANWEWLLGLPLTLHNIKSHAAYTKINNKYFENTLKKSRSRFGGVLYRTANTIKNIDKNYKNKEQSLYCLLSDQSPQLHKTHYWKEFMGVKVPIHTGAEMLAKKYNLSYVVWTSKKVKRGFYELEFQLITNEPNTFKNYDLTDVFLTISEKNINQQPEVYLWSHKRFKHRNKFEEWKKMKASKQKTNS
ncbi:lipid A biosynthesis acyltransferase [uncultured Polaribacter sp.]|uniref:lysophospholipid acyltransferase family protein n=1 Tax=uncultured Polaribacter sp. TaxID=174711 RepID=UPI0030D6E9B8|tara:strand:+ start:2315 stop:3238 length:924 start_codon:yes stop_codon:yes gene_type:complete